LKEEIPKFEKWTALTRWRRPYQTATTPAHHYAVLPWGIDRLQHLLLDGALHRRKIEPVLRSPSYAPYLGEASAVSALFDKRWDDQTYGKALRDSNAYSTGVIGHHNVVLVHMPQMGKVDAATAAAYLYASFQGIQLALLVGICGGVPFGNQLSEEILLGDVVISKGLVQYDLGRRFPNNRFLRKDTP
jgi:nucleoside phosphorylase